MRRILWVLIACTVLNCESASAASLGVYQGSGCTGATALNNFVGWFGRKPDQVLDFIASDSWQAMLDGSNWVSGCWHNVNAEVVFSLPMLPEGTDTLADGAAGKFDDKFEQIAAVLIAKGYGDAVIRIGWEFNGDWYPWAAAKDPINWVIYWRRIVTAMRGVEGAAFRFDWCPALGQQQIAANAVYPGDTYVDIIGQDVYNQSWSGVSTAADRWTELLMQPYGLQWHRTFATTHSKPMSFPEWATGTRPDGHGAGDDAYFIQQMASWIGQTAPLYHNYWDYSAPDFDGKLSNGSKPKAGAAFRQNFFPVPRPPSGVRG